MHDERSAEQRHDAVPEPGSARVGNDPNSGELDSSFGSNGDAIGNETRH